MKTKIVFSVVSGENDIYLSQAMTAAFSCRYYNPESTILLVVDESTAMLIEQKLSNMKKYINEIKKNINRKDDFLEAVFNYSFDTEFFNAI